MLNKINFLKKILIKQYGNWISTSTFLLTISRITFPMLIVFKYNLVSYSLKELLINIWVSYTLKGDEYGGSIINV